MLYSRRDRYDCRGWDRWMPLDGSVEVLEAFLGPVLGTDTRAALGTGERPLGSTPKEPFSCRYRPVWRLSRFQQGEDPDHIRGSGYSYPTSSSRTGIPD